MMIKLTPCEMMLGATIGIHRHMAAINRNLQDRHGFEGDGWGIHIEGACGEIAAARALGVYYGGSINSFRTGFDIGGYQVRTRSRRDYDLIIRDNDDLNQSYILVLGVAPNFEVVGFLPGIAVSRHPEWRKTYGGREECWFVPQSELVRIENF